MHETKLPKTCRSGLRTRELNVGLDLPSFFVEGMKGIDRKLFFVWHPYRLMWDDIMNKYTGELENPRFQIGRDSRFGEEEVWGWVLTDNNGAPIPENKWHCWRLCEPHGWAHIFPVENTDSKHLRYYLNRLFLRSQIQDKYGFGAWSAYEREAESVAREHKLKDTENLYFDTLRENKSLLRQAMENFERGVVDATNPTKEIITSYRGQKNHTKIIRPLDDREGGLYTPDKWN